MANDSIVGVVGHGRFGQAFAQLCQAGGCTVRVHDPHVEVPAALKARTLAEVTAGVDLVVVAVPLDQMENSFGLLAPHLHPGQVVMDVGSVKVLPSTWMAKAFGSRQPWVATHPLFGPASLARGERPLRTVVCPNPDHPQAVARVEAFFRALGCEPAPLAAEAHDREMALTHALAFFVAKGLLDVGAPSESPYAPPSFQGMARSIQAVRVDAGHLLPALHKFNPFASSARHLLMKALHATDLALGDAGGTTANAPTLLSIPDLGAQSPELQETRELIDELDEELLSLLARRAVLSRRAKRRKAEVGAAVWDPTREAKLLAARRASAEQKGLSPDAVEDIFQAILRFSRGLQH